jgi:flagellar biosynthesis protein FlhB
MAGEKTEKPTAQRKKKAVQEGQIPKTPDLGAWTGMLAASFLVPMALRSTMERTAEVLRTATKFTADPDPAEALELLRTASLGAAVALAPLALGMLLIGVAASGAQGGIHFSTKMLMPKFSRLNPLPGIKRAFGGQALWESFKITAKTAVVGWVLYVAAKDLVPTLMAAGTMPLTSIMPLVADKAVDLMRYAAGAGLAMAAADYAMARRRINKQIYMTKEEVKQEHKQTEGDPHVKSAIRSKMMAMGRNRMMAEIQDADVIVVNPTHYSVALRYEPTKGAPRVVAKGVNLIALKIREKAAEHRVPMVEDVQLARTLYKAVEIGQEIPPELYVAVARVLAFIMSLRSRGSAAGLHRTPTSV